MQGDRFGRWSGLWASTFELAEGMLLVTETGEVPIVELFEGAIVRDKELAAVVFEVLLRDETRGRWFITPV